MFRQVHHTQDSCMQRHTLSTTYMIIPKTADNQIAGITLSEDTYVVLKIDNHVLVVENAQNETSVYCILITTAA